MEKIRLATEEEIKSIESFADLTAKSSVMVMGENKAVWKIVNELDPVLFAEGDGPARRYKFIWGIENIMKGAGVSEYYFNIPVKDEAFRNLLVNHLGAKPTSLEPEMRYKITI